MKAICIDAEGSRLIEGNEYEVYPIGDLPYYHVRFIPYVSYDGTPNGYEKRRFILLSEKEETA